MSQSPNKGPQKNATEKLATLLARGTTLIDASIVNGKELKKGKHSCEICKKKFGFLTGEHCCKRCFRSTCSECCPVN